MGQSRLAGAEAKTPAQSEQRENSLAGPHVSGMGDDLMLYGQPRCFDWKVKFPPPHTHTQASHFGYFVAFGGCGTSRQRG